MLVHEVVETSPKTPQLRRLQAISAHVIGHACPRQRVRVALHGLPVAAQNVPWPYGERPVGWPAALPPCRYTEVPRFAVGDPESRRYLAAEGFVVYRDVLTKAQCEESLSKIWDDLERAGTGIDRNNPDTWSDRNWLPALPANHAASLWHIRGFPRIRDAWATAWETDELLVAFNTAYIWRPYGLNPLWKPPGLAYHIDRLPYPRPGASVGTPTSRFGHHRPEYYQGFCSLVRGSPEVGGNTLVPGSHLQYAAWAQEFATVETGLPVSDILDHYPEVFERSDPFQQSRFVLYRDTSLFSCFLVC